MRPVSGVFNIIVQEYIQCQSTSAGRMNECKVRVSVRVLRVHNTAGAHVYPSMCDVRICMLPFRVHNDGA